MMSPTAPIIIPPDYQLLSDNQLLLGGKREWRHFTRRHGVLFVSLVEMVGSIAAISVYIYALAVQPSWYPVLVPIPSDLCNATTVVHGVMYIIVLLCGMEFLMALYLFEGARREKLGRVRFWLSSMLTYLALVTTVIFGMDLGGIRCPTMNSAAFINIFVRFLEIIVVYAWVEQEGMQRRWRAQQQRNGLARDQQRSTMTICTMASSAAASGEGMVGVAGHQTPPPSYDSTVIPRGLSPALEQEQQP